MRICPGDPGDVEILPSATGVARKKNKPKKKKLRFLGFLVVIRFATEEAD